jgi:hypothetical protein
VNNFWQVGEICLDDGFGEDANKDSAAVVILFKVSRPAGQPWLVQSRPAVQLLEFGCV